MSRKRGRSKSRRRIRPKLLAEAKPIIEKIADAKKRNGKFAYFVGDDVFQEVWHICLRALARYDSTKGNLENYLNRCVSNGIKNLRRDRYYRLPPDNLDLTGETQTRINLINALPLGGGDIAKAGQVLCTTEPEWDPAQSLMDTEQIELVRSKLSPHRRADFERILAGERVPKPKFDLVIRAVKRIVRAQRDDENA